MLRLRQRTLTFWWERTTDAWLQTRRLVGHPEVSANISLCSLSLLPCETPVVNGDVRGMVVGRRRIISTTIKTTSTTVAASIYYWYLNESYESTTTPTDGRQLQRKFYVHCFHPAAASNPRVIGCHFHIVFAILPFHHYYSDTISSLISLMLCSWFMFYAFISKFQNQFVIDRPLIYNTHCTWTFIQRYSPTHQ